MKKPDLVMKKIFEGKSNDECFTSYTLDDEGNKVGFMKLENGVTLTVKQMIEGKVEVSTSFKDIFVIFSRDDEQDKPKKELMFPDGKGLIYDYDNDFNITEVKAV